MAPRRTATRTALPLITTSALLLAACAAPPPQRPLVGYAGDTPAPSNPAAATLTAPPPYVVMAQRELTDLFTVGEVTERRSNGSIEIQIPITNRSNYRYTISYQLHIDPTTAPTDEPSPPKPPATLRTAIIDPGQTLTVRDRFDSPEDAPIPTWTLHVDWATR